MHLVMLKMENWSPNYCGDTIDCACDYWSIAAGYSDQWQTTLQQTCTAEGASQVNLNWTEVWFVVLDPDACCVCFWQGANILLTDNGYVKLGEKNAQIFCNYLLLQMTESEWPHLLIWFLSLPPLSLSCSPLHIILSVLAHFFLFISP